MNWLWLSAVVIVFDQISKQLAENGLVLHSPRAVIEGFANFTLMYNKGAAFSFLSSAGGWQRWFFMAFSAAVSVALFIWLKRVANDNKILACGLALILGGAIGNLVDRTVYGHVIDFIQVYYQAGSCLPGFSAVNYAGNVFCYWPAFNIADTAIFLGAACLIIDMIREQKQHA